MRGAATVSLRPGTLKCPAPGPQPLIGLSVGRSLGAIITESDGNGASEELPVISQGASGRGSTLYVDFHSTKPIYIVEKCHLNVMVADTRKWEQSAAYVLDSHPCVSRWAKNDHLDFVVPYRKRNIRARYFPDFIVVLDDGLRLIIETKGRYNDDADIKAKAAERWVRAVNLAGEYGQWKYIMVQDSPSLGRVLDEITDTDGAAQRQADLLLTG